MADRNALSLADWAPADWAPADWAPADWVLDDTALVGLSRASRWTGIRVGDVISSTVPWAKANPVMAPHVLRLTSAVACCHVGFLTDCTESPSSTFPSDDLARPGPPVSRLRLR